MSVHPFVYHRWTLTGPQDIKGDWKKLGSGSFGNVYKGASVSFLDIRSAQILSHSLTILSPLPPPRRPTGTYLGIDVAIKEVLPSTDYDVSKYFEREWRLMKECRHPNICLFIGLSRGPVPPSNPSGESRAPL
jgi:LIM domain kinase 1